MFVEKAGMFSSEITEFEIILENLREHNVSFQYVFVK